MGIGLYWKDSKLLSPVRMLRHPYFICFLCRMWYDRSRNTKGGGGVLRLVIGTDWVAVRDEILKGISADVRAQKPSRIYMVPELISHDTERRLCEAAGDTASRFAEVLSFTRLARRVADQQGQTSRGCLDAGGRVVAMAAAARQLHSRLKTYAAVETKPEFLTQVIDMVDEFKRCRISAEDLRAASERAEGTLAQKLEELSLLLQAYDSICAQGKRDPRDQETQLLEQLSDGDFAENHVFYIDGFPDFTRQHLAILEHLITHSPQVTIGINSDEIGSKAVAFEKAGETASVLYRMARSTGVEVRVDVVPGRQNALGTVSCSLFQGAVPTVDGGCLRVFRCESVHDEVTVAAEQVMHLVRSGCRYRDIGIVISDPGTYENALEMVFHRCGIPLYRSGKDEILQKTVIFTVLAALEAALEGFEQRAVLRYLKSMLSPLDPDTSDLVENYAITWGIRGSGWAKEWVRHPEGLSAPWTEHAQRRLALLNDARERAIGPLLRLRQGFAEATKLADQVRVLHAFLEEIRLADRLDALARELDGAGDNRGAQIQNQLWEILISALEQLYDVLGETVWEPEAFLRLLKLLLSQYDVGTIPTVLDGVSAGPVTAMRCNQVKHLMVLGAAEGALPGYGGSQGLLSDQERTALRTLGVPLTGGALEGIQAEFAEIYGVFCGARETVTVSCAGEQPSYLYRRLADMAGGEVKMAPQLGAAMGDAQEAGAFLAKWNAWEQAQVLGIHSSYEEIRKKAEFDMGTISRENVRGLYGEKLNLSASQVDRQAECRMSYFLKYGLRAKERKESTVDPAEFGTYVHDVLEKTAGKVMELGGFRVVSLEKTMEIAMEYSDAYGMEHFSQIDSERVGYLFRRNRRELEMVVAELWQELKNARFEPKDFELQFGDGGRMDAIEVGTATMPAALRGFVDRVDIWQEDGRHYFRVVDYKTGKKDFDYCDVYNGVGLQMLLYLFALEQDGYGVSAGVQYFPARVPLLNVDGKLSAEEAESLRLKEWKRKGLLLDDEDVLDAMDPEDWARLCATRKKDGAIVGDLASREQLKLLRGYVFRWLGNMVEDIASGNVQPNPYTRGSSHDACAWCPYGSICHKGEVTGRRNYKAMTAQEFWEGVEKEGNRHGG